MISPARAHGGDPADRPRRDDRLEGIVRQAVVVLADVVEHCAQPRKAGDDFGERRARTRSSGALGRMADVDEARDLLVRSEAERVEHAAIVGIPFGDPGGAKTRARGRRRGGSWRRRPPRAPAPIPGSSRAGAARLTTAITSGARASRVRSYAICSGLASGYLATKAVAIASPAFRRASPSNTTKRHGVSLPWSGTREAMVSSVSSSAAEGPGGPSSFGLTERRCRQEINGIGHDQASVAFASTLPAAEREATHGKSCFAGTVAGRLEFAAICGRKPPP